MSDRNHPQAVEDYTNAFLVTFGAFLFMALFTIAALYGWIWTILTAVIVDWSISYSSRLRAALLRRGARSK